MERRHPALGGHRRGRTLGVLQIGCALLLPGTAGRVAAASLRAATGWIAAAPGSATRAAGTARAAAATATPAACGRGRRRLWRLAGRVQLAHRLHRGLFLAG